MSESLIPLPHGFARRLVKWQREHGRQHLPWQASSDPYRVWLSEIMLQQTQVSTVLDYYPRFLQRFPDVQALAAAAEDEVLSLWSGLGYYSRARNLHRCAQQVVQVWGGWFPRSAQDLQTLPGIGRSTAAAIAAFCFHERVAILDGNVKRVLGRVLAYSADLSVPAHERQLWSLAQQLLPRSNEDMPAYTQAVMDLGATVCLPRKAGCEQCPVTGVCAARQQNQPLAYPVKTRKIKRSSVTCWLLWAVNAQGQVWLQKRPSHGIWAGLYCLPVLESEESLLKVWPQARMDRHIEPWVHVLTHRDLHLHPVRMRGPARTPPAVEGQWIDARQVPELGLPAPIRQLLASG